MLSELLSLGSVDLQPLYIAVLIGGAVFIAIILFGWALQARERLARRVATSFGEERTLHATWQERSNRMVERAATFFDSGKKTPDFSLRRQLVQAGFFSSHAPALLTAARVVTAIGLPVVFLLSTTFLPFSVPLVFTTIIIVTLSLFGLVLPPILLDWRVRAMQHTYRNAFPDLMDLLVVCVESGQSLNSAISQVSRELMAVSPPLAFNLHLASLELRAGSSIESALMSLHVRVGVDEVKSLAILLKQSEELGSSIGGTLRVFSDDMRDKRLMRAETKANMLPVKLTIPLALFIFPVILIVIMMPVVIRIRHAFT